ncbi:MAG TPA: phosphate regulon sensor histidine kinase PhoR [Pseudomonadales bacterium]|nr:phosphate regulon sensor histidine kinase PhoR [Pseudomonadales bacterium]
MRHALPLFLISPIAVVIGLAFSSWYGWAFLCASLLCLYAFQAWHFTRLDRWTRNPVIDTSLEGKGAWDTIFGRLYHHEKDLRTQITLREQNIDLLRSAVQALADGVVLLDLQNHVVFCNSTAEMQLGLQLSADRGQSILHLVRQPEFVDYLEHADFAQSLTLRPERYRDRIYTIHIIPYAGSRRLMQIKDVTQAERIDQTRRDFVANVSHELRTPLTVLIGFLETLQTLELTTEERDHFLQLMAEQSQRMQSIVQDLLTLSTIESAPPPENTTVDMTTLTQKLQRDAETLSQGKHHIVVAGCDPENLRGSETELFSALGNLVTNAVRYTPEGGTITLRWHVSARGVDFSVQDTGAGIAAEHIPRLTERFYRVDKGRSRHSGGTGLGLAIAKHAITRHQGQLEIRSELGKGSCFVAHFPVSRLA